MRYQVIFTSDAQKDVLILSKNAPTAIKKLGSLLEELREHPRTGTGKVERLKHYEKDEIWSRRITQKHRLVYRIKDDIVEVLVLSAFGHYQD